MPKMTAPPPWGRMIYDSMLKAVGATREELLETPTDYDAQIAALMALRASVETAIMHTARQATLHAALPHAGRDAP